MSLITSANILGEERERKDSPSRSSWETPPWLPKCTPKDLLICISKPKSMKQKKKTLAW